MISFDPSNSRNNLDLMTENIGFHAMDFPLRFPFGETGAESTGRVLENRT